MNKFALKFTSGFLAIIIFSVFTFYHINVYALEQSSNNINDTHIIEELIQVVDNNSTVNNNIMSIIDKQKILKYIYKNSEKLKDALQLEHESNIYYKIETLIENYNKSILNNKSNSINSRGSHPEDFYTVKFWWGVKHTFLSDGSAQRYAYNIRQKGHLNAGTAILAGAIFGGVGVIPNGLTSVYAYSLADSVDYNANRPGIGVILEVNYLLFYNCKPR